MRDDGGAVVEGRATPAEGGAVAAFCGDEDEASIETARRLLLDLAADGTFPTPL